MNSPAKGLASWLPTEAPGDLADLGDARFYLCSRDQTYVLVWIVDKVSGRRHIESRPLFAADGLERVKDPTRW